MALCDVKGFDPTDEHRLQLCAECFGRLVHILEESEGYPLVWHMTQKIVFEDCRTALVLIDELKKKKKDAYILPVLVDI